MKEKQCKVDPLIVGAKVIRLLGLRDIEAEELLTGIELAKTSSLGFEIVNKAKSSVSKMIECNVLQQTIDIACSQLDEKETE